jgi:hypothetical protein
MITEQTQEKFFGVESTIYIGKGREIQLNEGVKRTN